MTDVSTTDAVSRYQSQVPSMRADLGERARQLNLTFQKEGHLFGTEYPAAVTRLAESEVRKRINVAAESLKEAIDAGWRPSSDELRNSLVACFNPNDYRLDSFSDIKGLRNAFTSNLGRTPDVGVDQRFGIRIAETQVQSVNEALSSLGMYLRRTVAHAQSSVPSKVDVTPIVEPISLDGAASRIMNYLENVSSSPYASVIASDLDEPLDVIRDELVLLHANSLVDAIRPDDYAVADARFKISDMGRAALAAARKRERQTEAANVRAANLTRALIQSDVKADRTALSEKVANVIVDCAARGIVHSGSMVLAVEKAVTEALRKRSASAVERIQSVLSRDEAKMTVPKAQSIYDGIVDYMFEDADALLENARKVSGVQTYEVAEHLKTLKGDLASAAHLEIELYADFPIKERTVIVEPDDNISNKVFVTHGRDRATRDAVANFLYGEGLQPIVLEDEASGGNTIIEKYEEHSNVAYGVAILSPDDIGCLKKDFPEGGKPRARQNVIFELGYMFAKISRHHVAVLIADPEIERPTNIDGVVFINLDPNDGWKLKLLKELRKAGMPLKNY